MTLKYILDKYGNFAIFSEANAHSDIAKGFHGGNSSLVGAGFCNIGIGHYQEEQGSCLIVNCYGESVSLRIKSRSEDSEIITRKLNNKE